MPPTSQTNPKAQANKTHPQALQLQRSLPRAPHSLRSLLLSPSSRSLAPRAHIIRAGRPPAYGLGFLGQRAPLASVWSLGPPAGCLSSAPPVVTRVRCRPWCCGGSRGRTAAAVRPSAEASLGESHRKKVPPWGRGCRKDDAFILFPPG
jgi:hypothetical protein